MVLIAAAVTTKAGKTIVSRQFVEMTKARIEGLLAAFPKLMSTGKQHTFVETESVRYVYQPLEKLYMLLITTKASNILEDLETLRLFSRVIPEYCRSMEESEIAENAFNLIFAFDEIVALGYRESVNLPQIRTFVEMDSHEEKVYQAVRQTQEREAKNKMREKAKELQRQRMEAAKRGTSNRSSTYSTSSGGFGSNSTGVGYMAVTPGDGPHSCAYPTDVKNNYGAANQKPVTAATRGGMKLGGKTRDVDSFVAQLKSEGENVANLVQSSNQQQTSVTGGAPRPATIQPPDNVQDVHLRQEERMVVKIGREGGLLHLELLGLLTLRIGNERWGRIRVQLENNDTRGIQLQTHPNVDKELFKMKSQIGLKNPTKPFPLHTDVGVLKYRLQTANDEGVLPLSINCWPTENGEGGCDVNIEYDLENERLELNDVSIIIPLPVGSTPTVNECEGEYVHESRKNQLIWNVPLVDSDSKTGALEFSCPHALPQDFYPVHVTFNSRTPYANIKISEVLLVDDESPVKHSVDTVFFTDKYEIA